MKKNTKKHVTSNCRDNHMKCMQRDIDCDMCYGHKQMEDILDFCWLIYLGKKGFLQAVCYWFWIKPIMIAFCILASDKRSHKYFINMIYKFAYYTEM